MNTIKKISAMIAAMLAVVILSACSSYEDPDTAFKGKIDDGFMNSLARGETSVTFRQTDYLKYEMDYDSYHNNIGKWHEVKELMDGESTPGFFGLVIHNGKSWRPVKAYQDATNCPSPLFNVWKIYCEETGVYKEVYVACPIRFDAEQKQFAVEDAVYVVESAENNELVLSYETLGYKPDSDNKLVPCKAYKYIISYKKAAMEMPDLDNILYFGSDTDAKIAMVSTLREYFGDEINLNHYHGNMLTYPIVNLKKIEEYLRNGKDEYEKDVIGAASK